MPIPMPLRLRDIALFTAFLATVPTANYFIGHVGTECIPNGPCLIPVGFGLMAPSGVLFIGAALVLRDLVQERLGSKAAIFAVALGAALSWFVAAPALAVASALSYAVAELLDFAVYTPLRRFSKPLAVLVSGTVGAVADSALFLFTAFGSLDLIEGQVVGKLWFSAAVAAWLFFKPRTVQT